MPNRKELEKAKKKEQQYQEEIEKKAKEEYWSQGVNKREQKKTMENREKQEEKMRLQKEKYDQIQEEESYSNCQRRPKSRHGRNKDPLYFLNESLANAPKTKMQQEREKKQKMKEVNLFTQLKREETMKERKQKEERENYLLLKKGIVKQNEYDLTDSKIRSTNRELFEEQSINATCINDALDILDKKARPISYNEYFEKTICVLKREMPGLRLSQYEDKVRKMWKNSFENPVNQL